MARQNSAAFFSGVLCASPSYLFSVNSCCYNRNFAFPFLCSLSSALLAKAIALTAIVCRNFLNCWYTFYSRRKPNPSATPLPRLLEIAFSLWMTFTLRYFLSFCTYHIPYGTVIQLSPHCKVRSQILLSPCSKGFLSYLKERFLHFNKRKIWVLCTAFKVLYVYYHAFYPNCI